MHRVHGRLLQGRERTVSRCFLCNGESKHACQRQCSGTSWWLTNSCGRDFLCAGLLAKIALASPNSLQQRSPPAPWLSTVSAPR